MESLNKIIDSRIPIVIEVATVLSISQDTCKVKSLTTGKIHFKCALNAIFKNDSEFIKFEPEVDSNVIIGIANEKVFVIQVSKVKSFNFKYKEMVFSVDENGFTIENKGESFKTVINDLQDEIGKLCDALNAVVVLPGYGTTPNVALISQIKVNVVTALKTRLNKILK